jgi:hypothetical protein
MIAFLPTLRRRWGGGLLCLLVVLAALLTACNSGTGSSEHPANAAKSAAKVDPATADTVLAPPVITDKVDRDQSPLSELKVVPRKTEVIYACIKIEGDLDDRFNVKWYHNGKRLANLDSEMVLSDFALTGWISFPIANEQPWTPGTYDVEVYYMDKLAGVTTFTIK